MRRRILVLVVGMTTLVVVAFAVPIALLIRSTVAQQTQRDTQTQARNIVFYLGYGSRTTAQLDAYVRSQTSTSGRPVWITLPSGKVVGRKPASALSLRDYSPPGGHSGAASGPSSTTAPTGGLPGGGYGMGGADRYGDGFGGGSGGPQAQLQSVTGGQVAESVARTAAGVYVVHVYLSDAARYDGEGSKFLLLGGAGAALIVIGAIAGEILTRRIVRPLVKSAATAQQLSHGDTSARAPTDGPAEVADVGRALNRLADRIDQLIAEERETVADLSHRLRTPLTALRLDAEALSDSAEAERVGAHVSALERTLTAVIHSARRPQREGRIPSADATAVVGERVEFWSALTEDQARTGTVELPPEPLPVRASAEDLAATVDALLENVVAHTPEGVGFAVRLWSDATGAVLEVSDDGPGLPPDAPVRGRSDRGSSGLGLDIARRCAEASGGGMTIGTSDDGGARITLRLGRP